MTISKRIALVFSGILLVSFYMIEITNANYIGYGPLKGDVSPGCGPKHPELCRSVPANPYQRGCTKIDRCRGGNDVIDEIEDEKDEVELGDASTGPAMSPTALHVIH